MKVVYYFDEKRKFKNVRTSVNVIGGEELVINERHLIHSVFEERNKKFVPLSDLTIDLNEVERRIYCVSDIDNALFLLDRISSFHDARKVTFVDYISAFAQPYDIHFFKNDKPICLSGSVMGLKHDNAAFENAVFGGGNPLLFMGYSSRDSFYAGDLADFKFLKFDAVQPDVVNYANLVDKDTGFIPSVANDMKNGVVYLVVRNDNPYGNSIDDVGASYPVKSYTLLNDMPYTIFARSTDYNTPLKEFTEYPDIGSSMISYKDMVYFSDRPDIYQSMWGILNGEFGV